MNGRLFQFLSSLTYLDLESTACISRKFENMTISAIANQVDKKCKFDETETIDLGLVCESISQVSRNDITARETCMMNGSTIISSKNRTIHFMLDQGIDGLYFNENKKIEFLPVEIYRSFPNLKEYWANNCSVREISKKNFEKLYQLNFIRLVANQIEKISSDTFKDSVLLRAIALSENKFKVRFKLYINFKFNR